MERLLEEIADLSAQGLTGAAVAISFCGRLMQPIQERVHPAFEYWGQRDPTRGHECKVPRDEIANLVTRFMAGHIRNKSCPKAHCLKRSTDAISLLEPCRVVFIRSGLFPLFLLCVFRVHPLGFVTTRLSCRPKSWSTGPPLLYLRGTLGRTPPPPPSCASRQRRRPSCPPTPPWGASRRWRSPEPQGRHCWLPWGGRRRVVRKI